jgi:hypothetical protein
MTNTLPIKAKVMIGMGAVASLCACRSASSDGKSQAWPQLVLLLAAAALSSRFKVKLPGMTSSMSGNLPVILLGVTQLGLFASLLVAVTAAIAQSYSGGNKTKPIQFVFNACTLLNAAGLAYLVLSQPDLCGSAGDSAHHVSGTGGRRLLPGEYGAGSEHHRTDGRRQSFCPVAQGVSVVVPELRNRCGIDCDRLRLQHHQRTDTVALLMAVLFAVYQSYKMYVGRAEQTQPKVMAMAAGR